MSCPRCGLPDPYRGNGDGIGSCDCRRCDCCGCGPDECYCGRDFDEMNDDPDEPFDPLCNDTGCGYRHLRLAHRLAAAESVDDEPYDSPRVSTVRTVLDDPAGAS